MEGRQTYQACGLSCVQGMSFALVQIQPRGPPREADTLLVALRTSVSSPILFDADILEDGVGVGTDQTSPELVQAQPRKPGRCLSVHTTELLRLRRTAVQLELHLRKIASRNSSLFTHLCMGKTHSKRGSFPLFSPSFP